MAKIFNVAVCFYTVKSFFPTPYPQFVGRILIDTGYIAFCDRPGKVFIFRQAVYAIAGSPQPQIFVFIQVQAG